ncbi:MAG: hypothetical protein O3A63_13905 [Proteobacteria bacterium]|nr:hypothetical protein [Pseudomonadota bacterium]
MLFGVSVACNAADDGYATVYATKSNQELTALSEQWHALDAQQRRALLTEVQSRMSQRSEPGVVRFRVQRRYGRIVRQPDGSVVRIETRVIAYSGQARAADAQQSFGLGFEQRAAARDQTSPPVQTVAAPALKVQQGQ